MGEGGSRDIAKALSLIKHLTELQGISAMKAGSSLAGRATPLVDKIEVSGIGNPRIACLHPEAPRLMLAAHMDEVGLLWSVRDYLEWSLNGDTIGGWKPHSISAQRYTLQTRKGTIFHHLWLLTYCGARMGRKLSKA